MDQNNRLTFDQDGESAEKRLFQRTVRGGFWVFALRIFTQVLSFVRYIILARLLTVEDFGLLGVAMLMMQILNTFSNTGFNSALIQKKGSLRVYLDVAWTVGIIRGVALFVILYWAAPYCMFNVEVQRIPLTINVIRVVGVSFLVSAISNIGIVYFAKELQFRRQFTYRVISTLIDVAVTISLALLYRSVWALVLGKLAGNLVGSALSYVMHPYRPRISFDFPRAAELWRFGKWVLGGTILSFILTQGDDIFVWGYLGLTALGLYQMAYKFSNIPATEITGVITQVTFPAYSKLQDDISRLKEAYLKVLRATAFLAVPLAGFIFILTPDFVALFLKEKWLPIIPAMQILSIFGMLKSIGTTRGPLFQAVGKPHISMKIKIIKLVLLIILIYPLTKWSGIAGTALVILFVSAILQPFGMYLVIRIIRCGVWEMLKPIIGPLGSTLIALDIIWSFKQFVFSQITYVSFFLLAIIGVGSYMAIICLGDIIFDFGARRMIREQWQTLLK